jgi:hypothetical protein
MITGVFTGAVNDGPQIVIETNLTPHQMPINREIIGVIRRGAGLQQRLIAYRDPLRPTTAGVHPRIIEPEQDDLSHKTGRKGCPPFA